MVRLALLFALVALIITTAWTVLGRPLPLPPSPLAPGERLSCLSYTPFRGDEAPWSPLVPDEQIADDLKRLSEMTSCIRTYSAARPANVTQLAAKRSASLEGLAVALNTSLRRRSGTLGFIIACLFAATLVAAIHMALGLVFDPRYKDFQFALLSGPVAALAILVLMSKPLRVATGVAEWVTAALLTGSAAFIIANEGVANWQALWVAGLLLTLAFTALRSASSPS
jgi:hypothetical protein